MNLKKYLQDNLKNVLRSTILKKTVPAAAEPAAKPELKFKTDGTFKIVMFSDFQDNLPINKKSLEGMNKVLDMEEPDFVMLAGDQTRGGRGIKNVMDFRYYVNQMVSPMESRKIPWAHIYGNHDDEIAAFTGLSKAVQQSNYELHPYCLSQRGPKEVDGIGNYVLQVKSSKGNNAVFHIWALDSNDSLEQNKWYKGNLAKDAILPKGLQGNHNYDFLKFSQIMWYWNTSLDIEKTNKKKVPGIMFLHIPLPEHRLITMNPEKTRMQGEVHEDQCNSPINSGMFAAVLQRGDIKGIFAGHDHANDYSGTYCGIKLGYDGSIGYDAYGLGGENNDRLRGARIIEIKERDPWNFTTRMVHVSGL